MIKIKQKEIEETGFDTARYFYDITNNDVVIGEIVLKDRGYFAPVLIEKFKIYEEFRTTERCIYALEYVLFITQFFKSKTIEYRYSLYKGQYVADFMKSLEIAKFREFDEGKEKVFKCYR